ncbi:hypothetical protein LTS17_009061 [Exophiala oligosperma]
MLVNTLFKTFVVSLTLRSSSVLADSKIDQAKVQKYKALFAPAAADADPSGTTNDSPTKTFDPAVLESPFKWSDVVHGAWWFSGCQPSCQACLSGCNLACCVRHPFPWPPPPSSPSPSPSSSKSPSGGKKPGSTPTSTPKSPLDCPCTCEDDCPPQVRAVCCSTTPESSESKDTKDGQKPLELDTQHTEICPCHCEASCPTWIQAICCDTPGSGSSDSEARDTTTTKPGSETFMGLVLQNSAGEPVTVLATTNLTVEQSFVTFDLVRGLGRIDEMDHDGEKDTFQIVLDVIVGPAAGDGTTSDKSVVLKQSFQVIDGSRLFEREQILLGVKFLARIDGLEVKKTLVGGGGRGGGLEDGLKIETGERPADQKEKGGHDEL